MTVWVCRKYSYFGDFVWFALTLAIVLFDIIGQALAVKELYGFFGNLLINYQIFPANKENDPNKTKINFKYFGFGLELDPPTPVKICKIR